MHQTFYFQASRAFTISFESGLQTAGGNQSDCRSFTEDTQSSIKILAKGRFSQKQSSRGVL